VPFALCLCLILTPAFAAKYDDMTEKLDSFIADSLACKTSLAALSWTDDERQRMTFIDTNTSGSSYKLNKYLTRKFDAESSKKHLEEKTAAAKQAARLRRMGVKPGPVPAHDDVDAAYKTPRPYVDPAAFAVVEAKNETTLSRPQTSMKNRIEEIGARVDAAALNVGSSGGGDDASASSNLAVSVNRLLLKSSQGVRPWSQKDLPLIESARARIVQMRAAAADEASLTQLQSQTVNPSSPHVAVPSPSTAKFPLVAETAAHADSPKLTQALRSPGVEAASPQTPASSRRLLRTAKQLHPPHATASGASPDAKNASDATVANDVPLRKKKQLAAEDIDAMAHQVLDTFYARLLSIYRGDCAHFKCSEVSSFTNSLQKSRVTITSSGQNENDLSLACPPLANVIPYIPQMRALHVIDFFINAAAAEQLLSAVLRTPQLRLLQFEFCRVSLDCCAAVGLALSRDDADESNANSASQTSGKRISEQQKKAAAAVMFKVPDDSSGAAAALQGAAADMAGDAAKVLGQDTSAAGSKAKAQAAHAAGHAEDSDGGTDGEDMEKKSAAIRLARVKRIQRAASLEKGLPNLVVLKMSQCNLTGKCVAALCLGLSSNRGVQRLDLSHNRLGDNAAGCESVGKLLETSSTLTSVNIGHNNINNNGSLPIARGLMTNSTLQHLDLQSNLFGAPAAQAALADSLRSPANAITHLILKNCGLDAISAVILSDGMVAAPRLKFADVSHNMLGAKGCHALLYAHCVMSTRERQCDWNKDSLVIAPLLASSGVSSQQQGVSDATAAPNNDYSFDVADFPGRYTLTVTSAGSYHNSILRWMLHFEATGRAVISSMIDSKSTCLGASEELHMLRACAKSVGAWAMPLDSVANRTLIVTCQSVFNRIPGASDTLSAPHLHCLDSIISASSAVDEMNAVSFVPALLPLHSWLSATDALSVLKVIVRSTERVAFCAFAAIALVDSDPEAREKLVAALSHKEQQLLKKRLSKSALEWTPYNATGRWLLNLADAVDRRLAHTLCSMLRSAVSSRNRYSFDAVGFDASGLPFGPKVLQPGDLWRNGSVKQKGDASVEPAAAASAKSRPLTASATAQNLPAVLADNFPSSGQHELPRAGVLEVDFVCVHRPSSACTPVDGAAWQCIVDNVTEVLRTGDFVAMQHELLLMRHRSNSIYLSSDMLHQLLNLVKLPTSRSDLAVMFYNRVTDWIGLQRKLQNWLSYDVYASVVERRIGIPVAFDDFSLVGYYDLQLNVDDHRNLLKRLLMSINDGIGLDVHDWVYDGVADDCPREWGGEHVEIPRNSYATFRISCSAQLLDSIKNCAGAAIPKDWSTLQPAGAARARPVDSCQRYRCSHLVFRHFVAC
jgi:hypothetical protein